MTRKKWITLVVLVLLACVGGLVFYYADLPNHLSQHETLVMGQNTFTPGSTASVRVVVQDTSSGAPLAGAQIKIAMKGKSGPATDLYAGTTDPTGTANVSFKVPDTQSSDQTLLIETRSSLGRDTIERPVTVRRDYRVLLTSDKPIYQPGQTIHLRALALGAIDLQPAQKQDLEITIADGKGNKVFRKILTTSDYGVAATDFELAAEVNPGNYKITAKLGNTSSEKTVSVETYALPKFGLKLEPEKPFYLPNEKIRGSLSANYFYGKPVAGGKVEIEGYTFDVQRNVVLKIDGQTDALGNYVFEFNLPSYLTGSELDKGGGRFYLQATVTDLAGHTELTNISLPVTNHALIVAAIPEGGYLRPYVENIVYILTSYPDGSPAETNLKLTFTKDNNEKIDEANIVSGVYGVAEVHYTPREAYQNLLIEARDKQGNSTTQKFNFRGPYAGETILLRPEKPVYKVGEAMRLTILSDKPTGAIYLDIVRENQVISTRSAETQDGKAEIVVDLTPDLYGTLELHAYKLLRSGDTVRDTRKVVVDQADGLKLALSTGQATYKPGDNGQLNFQVTGSDGKGTQAVLGVAIVDEAVFALAQQDPGFAKLYFMLEKQLLEPKYELHGYSLPDLANGKLNDPQLGVAVSQAAQASLAEAVKKTSSFSLLVNSRQENLKKAREIQSDFFNGFSNVIAALIALTALVMVVIAGYSLQRRKILGRSLLLALAFIPAFILLVMFLAVAIGFLYPLLMIIPLIGFIGLIAIVLENHERELRWQSMLLGGLVIAGFVFAGVLRGNVPSAAAGGLVIIAFALYVFAFWLHAAGFIWQRQGWAAAAAGVGGLLPLEVLLVILALSGPAIGRIFATTGAVMPTVAPSTAAEPLHLRQYFPETMLWLPEAVTQPDGSLKLDVPVADSITTWRVTALASTQDGRLGSAAGSMRVFQDFFVDLDLPTSLTVGDEVSVPVGVFNYLANEQTVRLELAQAGWFELKDEAVKEIKIAANDISVVYFRIRAKAFGQQQPFRVTALGSKMSDAIKKEVTVYPDGKPIRTTASDRLTAGQALTQRIKIPSDVIAATPKLWVKIYPGMLSQVVDGLENILRMPSGCFEQTSSTTYPNVLVLDYLKSTRQVVPEVQMKAEQYINLGYQRLTTFEVKSSGGFSLYGNEPASRMLTAYGLQEFSDMSRVHAVDPALMQRAAQWLLSQQESDGAWQSDRNLTREAPGNDRLLATAYITWSLVEAGFGNESGTQKGLNYVRASHAQDPYTLALVANALVSADLKAGGKLNSATEAALSRLAEMAQRDDDKVYWTSQVASFMGSQGLTGSLEITALASLAFQRADRFPELANSGLSYILKQKDSFGTWHNTQATVLALKALIQSVRSGGEKVNANVTVTLNGGQARTIQVTPENPNVVQLLSFDDVPPGSDNKVEFKAEGQGNLMYQVVSSYYLPWDALGKYPDLAPGQDAMSIDVKYDRTQIAVNDTVSVTVNVNLKQKGARAESALVDLGLPPGFTVLSEDLDGLVERSANQAKDYQGAVIQRYEITGRQILVYLTNLSEGQPLSFSYRLRAKFPLAVRSPASTAYDYYNPAVAGEKMPQGIEVR